MSNRSAWLTVTMMALAVAACTEERPPVGGSLGGSGGNLGSGGDGETGGDVGAGGSTSSSMGGAQGVAPPDYTPCANPPVDYPSAPYGHEVGDTMAWLDLEGWVNADGMGLANTEPFVTFDMDAIRGAGTTHVMLHLAATW